LRKQITDNREAKALLAPEPRAGRGEFYRI
jgi:hypothetical protein